MGHCFLLLLTWSHGFVTNTLAYGVNFVDHGTFLKVAANQGHNHAQGSHAGTLGEPLKVVAQILRKHVNWHLVSKFVLELGRLLSHPCHDVATVVHVAHDHCTNIICDIENASHRISHNKRVWNFFLGANDHWVNTPNGYWGLSEWLRCLECVLELIDAAIRCEDFHDFILCHLCLISCLKIITN